nr:hypothetical protein [uncultured Brevundimonas sp.]
MAVADPGPSSKPLAHASRPQGQASFSTRHYIGAMCLEMARMAEDDGDEVLADALLKAAKQAGV